jgi:hypothetical protein
VADVARAQGLPIERWGEALLQSYADALDDTDALVLEVRPAQGRA